MKTKIVIVIVALLVSSSIALAVDNKEAPGPCKQIAQICQNAGFIKGDWKKGDGLWKDCVDPIMQGQTNVPGATKALPTVDPNLVTACKAKHPKFGGGKVGTK